MSSINNDSEEKRWLWQAAANEFAKWKLQFIEFNRRLNLNSKYNPKFFLDHDFNIIFEFDGDDELLDSKTDFPYEYLDIVAISDVVIMNLPDYGYKKIIKNRFIDYDVDKYKEIKREDDQTRVRIDPAKVRLLDIQMDNKHAWHSVKSIGDFTLYQCSVCGLMKCVNDKSGGGGLDELSKDNKCPGEWAQII